MIKTVGEHKIVYVISTKSLVVSGLLDNGVPMFGGTYLEFSSAEQARSYLLRVAQKCIIDGNYDLFEKHNYEISMIETRCNTTSITVHTLEQIFSTIRDYKTEYELSLVQSCIVVAVREGFAKIGLDSIYKVQDLLNDVKYKSIIEDYIPSYVQENIDKFINVGTATCSGTDKGAIMLTSPDDLLERIKFK